MKIRYFTPEDYNEVCSWWKLRNTLVWDLKSLPLGVVVYDNNKNCAVVFMYSLEGTDLAQICLATTNPNNKFGESYKAVDLAIDALLMVAKNLNKSKVISLYKTGNTSTGMTKMLKKKGIIANDSHIMAIGEF